MAGDWMKIELELPDKPEIHAMSTRLQIDPDAVVCKLIRVWQWFDKHTTNGNAFGVTSSLLDRISGVTGFADAMVIVGWLEQNETSITMPKFERHTSSSAKTRALTAKRVSKVRNATTVTEALPEKRREEKNKTVKPKEETSAFNLPEWIDQNQWDLWMKTRKGKKMIAEQMSAQIGKLSKWRDEGLDHCGALANAAANGYTGLFLPSRPNSSQEKFGPMAEIRKGAQKEPKNERTVN